MESLKVTLKKLDKALMLILLVGIPALVHIERLNQIPPRPVGREEIEKMLNSKADQVCESEDWIKVIKSYQKAGLIDFWYMTSKKAEQDRAIKEMIVSTNDREGILLIGIECELDEDLVYFGIEDEPNLTAAEFLKLAYFIDKFTESYVNLGWYLRSLWKKLTLSKDPPEPFHYL